MASRFRVAIIYGLTPFLRFLNFIGVILFAFAVTGCFHTASPRPVPSAITEARYIYVGNEVRAPNLYAWTNGMRLTNAIEAAGGFTEFSDPSRVSITRADGYHKSFNYDDILKGVISCPAVRAGDYIHVIGFAY